MGDSRYVVVAQIEKNPGKRGGAVVAATVRRDPRGILYVGFQVLFYSEPGVYETRTGFEVRAEQLPGLRALLDALDVEAALQQEQDRAQRVQAMQKGA
jgi:hypothetical protein